MASQANNYQLASGNSNVASSSATVKAEHKRPPKIIIDTQMTPSRQKLRRRRSSLTAATSPISAIKSPTRIAGISFSRALLMSPSKNRDLYDVDEGSQNFGRLISNGTFGRNVRYVYLYAKTVRSL